MLYHYFGFPEPSSKSFTERSEHLRQILIDSELYLGQPASLNDPFDFALSIAPPTPEQHARFKDRNIVRTLGQQKPDNTRVTQAEIDAELARHADPQVSIAWAKEICQAIINKSGVFCLSARRDNTLMWSHYAGKHGGVCLGFDTSRCDGLASASKVAYAQLPVVFKYFDAFDPSHADAPLASAERASEVRESCLTKWSGWSYEEEYRIVTANPGPTRKARIQAEALVEVVFGYKAPREVSELVEEMLRHRPLPVNKFTVSIKEGEFSLDVRPR